MSSFGGGPARGHGAVQKSLRGLGQPEALASGYAPKAYRAARFANAKPRSARHLGLFRSSLG